MNRFDQQLELVRETYASYEEEAPLPATQAAIEEARAWFSSRFGQDMPDSLASFWQSSSGVGISGITLWAPVSREGQYPPGVIETNELYGLEDDVDDGSSTRCLFGQRDSIDHYVYNTQNGKWEIVDQYSMTDVFETYDTFEELAATVLAEGLAQRRRIMQQAAERNARRGSSHE